MALSDEDLDAYLAARPPAPVPPWLPDGFAPRWRGGAALSVAAARWLLGRLLAQHERAEETEVERLRARLDVSSAAAWMDEVCARGGATPERFSDSAWLFASLGAEPHLVPIGAGIAALWRHHGTLPLEVLRRNGTDAAVRRLGRVLHRSWHRKLGRAALERLTALAEARGTDPWTLLRETSEEPAPPLGASSGLVLPLSAERDDPLAAHVEAAPEIPAALFRERLAALDYRVVEVEDAGMVYHHARHVHGHLIHLDHSGVPASGAGLLRPVRIEQVAASRLPETRGLTWREAPPALLSLAFQDLRTICRGL
ncbi:MAG: hypothetical protein EVA89_36885 [Sandaracinaceae bacterium]|nr:MAG: hypothetical protein EVA89_36885 [Sandaracinaceae bacterium]